MTKEERLTDDEIALVKQFGQWWNAFCELPQMHSSDASDVLFHIHALQRIVMARIAQRAHPEHFPIRLVPPVDRPAPVVGARRQYDDVGTADSEMDDGEPEPALRPLRVHLDPSAYATPRRPRRSARGD
jgi:hypothetical protein